MPSLCHTYQRAALRERPDYKDLQQKCEDPDYDELVNEVKQLEFTNILRDSQKYPRFSALLQTELLMLVYNALEPKQFKQLIEDANIEDAYSKFMMSLRKSLTIFENLPKANEVTESERMYLKLATVFSSEDEFLRKETWMILSRKNLMALADIASDLPPKIARLLFDRSLYTVTRYQQSLETDNLEDFNENLHKIVHMLPPEEVALLMTSSQLMFEPTETLQEAVYQAMASHPEWNNSYLQLLPEDVFAERFEKFQRYLNFGTSLQDNDEELLAYCKSNTFQISNLDAFAATHTMSERVVAEASSRVMKDFFAKIRSEHYQNVGDDTKNLLRFTNLLEQLDATSLATIALTSGSVALGKFANARLPKDHNAAAILAVADFHAEHISNNALHGSAALFQYMIDFPEESKKHLETSSCSTNLNTRALSSLAQQLNAAEYDLDKLDVEQLFKISTSQLNVTFSNMTEVQHVLNAGIPLKIFDQYIDKAVADKNGVYSSICAVQNLTLEPDVVNSTLNSPSLSNGVLTGVITTETQLRELLKTESAKKVARL